MDRGLFDALFNDESLGFRLDGKKLEESIDKHKEKGSASQALFGGLELFEGKLPTDQGTVPNDDETMNALREGGAGGGAGAGGFGGGRGSAESGDPKVEEDQVKEDTAGVASSKEGSGVAGVVKKAEDTEITAKEIVGKGVKEGTAGVASDKTGTGVAGVVKKAEDTEITAKEIVGNKKMKEDVGQEKVLGEFSDEGTAKDCQGKNANSKMSQYKSKDGKDVWRVTLMDQGSGMAESCEQSFTTAMTAYQKVVVESRKKIREEKDPLNAGLVALKNTIQNMLNFHSAGDTKQAVEYATLATKQAADIGANLQTMASAEEAAAGVHKGGMGGAMDMPTDGVSDAASATADSLPTGAGGEMAPAGEEMNDIGDEEDIDIPEEDVEVPEEEYAQYESKYTSLEEAHIGFKKLQGEIEGEGKSKEAAAAIAASVGRRKYGKAKFQAMAKKGKMEGKLPPNAGDPNSNETMNDLREKKVQEAAEKAYLVLKLKERTSLTEKEKAFIEAVEKEVIDENLRAEAKVVLEKMLQSPPTTKKAEEKDKTGVKKTVKDQEKELKSAEKKG